MARDLKAKLLKELAGPGRMKHVVSQLTRIVADTFVFDRSKYSLIKPAPPTQAEITRRSDMAWEWFKILRGDMKYGTDHALDLIPSAMRAKLDGLDWEPPPKDRAWGVKTKVAANG